MSVSFFPLLDEPLSFFMCVSSLRRIMPGKLYFFSATQGKAQKLRVSKGGRL